MATTSSSTDRIDPLLTEQEVADACRVVPRTIRRWSARGYLPRMQLGGATRYRLADVESFIQRGTSPTNSERPAATPGAATTQAELTGRDGTD